MEDELLVMDSSTMWQKVKEGMEGPSVGGRCVAGLFPLCMRKPAPCAAPGAGSKKFPLISVKSLRIGVCLGFPRGASLPQVEELSQLEVDMEEKMGRVDQSLAQVKGVSCRMRWWIGPSFLDFPLPTCLEVFPASPRIAGYRRRWMSCASPWRQGTSPRTTTATVLTTMSTSLGAGSSSCLTRQVGCSWGSSWGLPGHPASQLPWSCCTALSPCLSPWCCGTPGTPVILSHGIGWWKCISVAGAGGRTELY